MLLRPLKVDQKIHFTEFNLKFTSYQVDIDFGDIFKETKIMESI